MKKSLGIILTLVIIVLSCAIGIGVNAEESRLMFSEDGKLKIVIFSDCQDDYKPSGYMTTFMDKVVKYEKPDLAIFLGDNIVEDTVEDFIAGITPVVETVTSHNVPFAYVYGNHDDEYGVSKEEQYEIYKSLGNCLTYDADPSLTGFGTCNIPVFSSDGSDIAFNLWLFDSNTYINSAHSRYDNVHSDQLEWFTKTNSELESQVGHKVNSIAFQHIPTREIKELLEPDPDSTIYYKGTQQTIKKKDGVEGYLGKNPSPSSQNSGELDTLIQSKSVLALVNGHDHINTIKGNYNGIDLIEAPGMSFRSFGDDHCRGCMIIEIDEKDTSSYTSRTLAYNEYAMGAIAGKQKAETDRKYVTSTEFISDINTALGDTSEAAKTKLESSGYTVIDKNLNEGTNGKFVYMGYKTSTDYKDAITDIRFYSHLSNTFKNNTYLNINGTQCYYQKVGVDLNADAGGTYIYAFYTRNAAAGRAVTAIDFASSYSSADRVCTKMLSATARVELNEAVSASDRDKIYCVLTSAESTDNNPYCGHFCHAEEGFQKQIWSVINRVLKYFKIWHHCKCGDLHW